MSYPHLFSQELYYVLTIDVQQPYFSQYALETAFRTEIQATLMRMDPFCYVLTPERRANYWIPFSF